MEICFISKKEVLMLPGEATKLDAYMLSSQNSWEKEIIDAHAMGYCYAKHLKNSPWADFWGTKLKSHFLRNLGLRPIATVEDLDIFLNTRTKMVTLLHPYGVSLDLPKKEEMLKGKVKDGFRRVAKTFELNIHNLPGTLASEIQSELDQKGEYALDTLAEKLGIQDCFLHPEALANSKLVFDRELKMYWNKVSTSSMCTYEIPIPEAVITALEGFEVR